MRRNIFAETYGIVAVGVLIGILAPLLQKLGNPGNMGICVACFLRDIAGSLGLHRAAVVQYLRPEILCFVLGSSLAAFLFGEFKPRGGLSSFNSFLLGLFRHDRGACVSGVPLADHFAPGRWRCQCYLRFFRPYLWHKHRHIFYETGV
nr:hypothetical protein [Thermodesulfatator atlanticus]